jgi:hypothetical protein
VPTQSSTTRSDFGIDAQVEIVEDDEPNGRVIALQIKSGPTFFARKRGSAYRFFGEKGHPAKSSRRLSVTKSADVELAYRRRTALEKRRYLMRDWSKFCDTPSIKAGNVIHIGAA